VFWGCVTIPIIISCVIMTTEIQKTMRTLTSAIDAENRSSKTFPVKDLERLRSEGFSVISDDDQSLNTQHMNLSRVAWNYLTSVYDEEQLDSFVIIEEYDGSRELDLDLDWDERIFMTCYDLYIFKPSGLLQIVTLQHDSQDHSYHNPIDYYYGYFIDDGSLWEIRVKPEIDRYRYGYGNSGTIELLLPLSHLTKRFCDINDDFIAQKFMTDAIKDTIAFTRDITKNSLYELPPEIWGIIESFMPIDTKGHFGKILKVG